MRPVLLFLALILTACTQPPMEEQADLQSILDAYIQTYQERQDWEAFLAFYSDTLYMKDVNLKVECKDLESFKTFYDWPNPDFKKLFPEQQTFDIDQVLLEQQTAVIRGRFLPFFWKGERQNWAGDFTLWLLFNEEYKIIEQYDYIVYPPEFLN